MVKLLHTNEKCPPVACHVIPSAHTTKYIFLIDRKGGGVEKNNPVRNNIPLHQHRPGTAIYVFLS